MDAVESLKEKMVLALQGAAKPGLGRRLRACFGAPNGETAMHTSIYKARPDVQCVLHYHPDALIAVSISGHGIKVVANCGVHFYRGTPIYDSPLLIRTDPLGDKVAATLGDRNAVLLRGHGGTVVAKRSRHLAAHGTRSGAHGPDPDYGVLPRAGEDALPGRVRANGQIS